MPIKYKKYRQDPRKRLDKLLLTYKVDMEYILEELKAIRELLENESQNTAKTSDIQAEQ